MNQNYRKQKTQKIIIFISNIFNLFSILCLKFLDGIFFIKITENSKIYINIIELYFQF